MSCMNLTNLMDKSKMTFGGCVISGLIISIRDSVSHGNGLMPVTSKCWIGFDPSYTNEVIKTITERKQVRFVSAAHGFIYTVGNIGIGGNHSVQSLSLNVWISTMLTATIFNWYRFCGLCETPPMYSCGQLMQHLFEGWQLKWTAAKCHLVWLICCTETNYPKPILTELVC